MLADALTIMSISVGTKVGLVDKMLLYHEPKSCVEIANDAGLKERYSITLFGSFGIPNYKFD